MTTTISMPNTALTASPNRREPRRRRLSEYEADAETLLWRG